VDQRWLPLVGPFGQEMITVDCALPPGQPSPVRRVDWSRCGELDYATPRAPSLGAVVAHWTALLSADEIRLDPDTNDWLWISKNLLIFPPEP
jgi:hypothetical protein